MSESLIDLLVLVAAQPSLDAASKELQRAAHDLERALRAALGAQTLLGLPNLGTRVQPYYGLNLDSVLVGADTLPFPHTGKEYGEPRTVLSERGYILRVQMVRRGPSGSRVGCKPWFEVTASSGFPPIAPQHLSTLTRLLPTVLIEHLRLSSEMKQRYVSGLKHASMLIEALRREGGS